MPVRLTPAIKIILIASVAAYLIQHTLDQFFGFHITETFGLVPERFVLSFWFWQILSYSLMHGPPWHLFFNMLMLLFVGIEIEARWGTKKFLKYYAFCVACSGVAYVLMQFLFTEHLSQPMVGASGGIFGLLIAYGIIFGDRVMLFMMLFPMKAKHFIWILAGIEFMTLVYTPGAALSGVAHLAGMAAGFMYLVGTAYLRLQMGKKSSAVIGKIMDNKSRKKKDASHLRLVSNKEPTPKEFEKDSDKGPKTWN
jgi:membrane associated rhomboid family serine protease